MCWNASISINTYIFTTFASLFAYYNNVINIYNLLFIQSVAVMQLVEYFVWSKTFSNMWLSIIGLIIVLIQPIFSILQISINNKYRNWLLGLYLIAVFIQYGIVNPWNNIDFQTIPAKNGHLKWKWTLTTIFGSIWSIFLLFPLWINKYYIPFWFGLFTFLYFAIKNNGTYTVGSMWCWIANLVSIFIIGLVFWKDLSVRFC